MNNTASMLVSIDEGLLQCQSSPSLPPEIWHEIFGYLIPEDPLSDLHLDLLSCSLVSTSWYHVAINTIPATIFQDILLLHKRETHTGYHARGKGSWAKECTFAELVRFADLVQETRRLGLTAFDSARLVHLDMAHLFPTYNGDVSTHLTHDIIARNQQQGEEAMEKLLSALSRSCDKLSLRLDNVIAGCMEDSPRTISRIASWCWKFSSLQLFDDLECLPSPKSYPIAPIIASSIYNLTSIELNNIGYDQTLMEALSQCKHITEATLALGTTQYPIEFLKFWPDLQILRLREMPLLSLILEAVLSCRKLTTLDVIGIAERSDFDAESRAFPRFLAAYPSLVNLSIVDNRVLQDDFLDSVLSHGTNLAYLRLNSCPNLCHTFITEANIRMCRLKRLNVKKCWRLSHEFILMVIRACPGLEEITLPEDLSTLDKEDIDASNNLIRELEEAGFFSSGRGDEWRRSVVMDM